MSDLSLQKTFPSSQRSPHSLSDCDLGKASLDRARRLREELDRVVRALEDKHLSCCLFPQLEGAAEIVRAVLAMSASRTGALIAVERRVSLEEIARSGIRLDAELNASLLQSLFFPGNPLHDGAVIVRGKRILAANCVLPLVTSETVRKTPGLGTRHQAGLSLSQTSDAVVYIVSEETGRISMALESHLIEEPHIHTRPEDLTGAMEPSKTKQIKGSGALAPIQAAHRKHRTSRHCAQPSNTPTSVRASERARFGTSTDKIELQHSNPIRGLDRG